MIEELLREVQGLADERMDELLPMLLAQLVERDGLNPCRRHGALLFPYVRAQIALTRANRDYYRWDGFEHGCPTPSNPCSDRVRTTNPETRRAAALTTRDEARRIYRAEPCTCWVPHR